MECDELIISFKEKSKDILNALSLEDYDKVIELFGEREHIINDIKNLNCSKEYIRDKIKENDLAALDDNIRSTMEKKMADIKASIKKLKAGGKANTYYNKNFYNEYKMFSKKI